MNAKRSTAILHAFGARVSSLRLQAGLSTAELAQRAHLSTEVLDAIEAGQLKNVITDDVFQLAAALGVQPADLFTDDPPAAFPATLPSPATPTTPADPPSAARPRAAG